MKKLCVSEDAWPGSCRRACPAVASYLEFYANIPDYNELHDLSDAEFYQRLQALKETQSLLAHDDRESSLGVGNRPSSESSLSSKPACATSCAPHIVVHSPVSQEGETPSCSSPPFHQHLGHRDLCRSMGALSLDSSGLHIHGEQCDLRPHSRAASRVAKIERKHAVPILSRIPLFDKIMAEQEERRKVIHHRNSEVLQSMIRPFSFTKREEAEKRMREECMIHRRTTPDCSRSHPNVSECTRGGRSRSRTRFRARPVPRDLFSDRAYDRMRDDQFCRALRKRMRAEEMLKNARMPPSMEARDRSANFKVNSESRRHHTRNGVYRDVNWRESPTDNLRQNMMWRDAPANQKRQQNWQDTPYNRRNTAWLDATNSQLRSSSAWRVSSINQSNSSSADISPNESTLGEVRKKNSRQPGRRRARPSSNISASKSNLASLLRTQTARSRLEKQVQSQIEDQHQKEHARMKARLLRLSPAWRALDYSTDEDLALRLQQRRHEAKVLYRKHRALMEGIQGRVHDIPPLFQEPGRTKITGERRDDVKCRSLDSSLDITGHDDKERSSRVKSRSFCVESHITKSPDSLLMYDD